jgi:transcription elongation factor Elf1
MTSDFKFSLLENGLDFLLSALEHLTDASALPTSKPTKWAELKRAADQKRHLKYALLHLCSSIELIFKERLRQEHWSLLFADTNKANKSNYDEGDFQSVTFQEAQDRLVGICGIEISDKHKRQLKNLREQRNRIEHFYSVDSLLAVSANVSTMVSFLIDFVESSFEPESLEEEEGLLSDIRAKLGTCNAFVDRRWKEIQKEVDGLYTKIECPTCHQEAMSADGGTVKCRFCNHTTDSEDAATQYVSRVLGYHSRYAVEKDGGEWPLQTCPECGHETLVTQVPGACDSHEGFCFTCGEDWGPGDLARCSECAEPYGRRDEGDIGICGNCLDAKFSKDD